MFIKEQIHKIRDDFPYLKHDAPGGKIIYFDNGATTQKPWQVIEGIRSYYEEKNGNPHRGAHYLSMESTEIYEGARDYIASWIGAKTSSEVVFVKNATEGLNLLAYHYALGQLKVGDEILISIMEHHANLVIWQFVAKQTGAILKYLYLDEDMQITEEELEEKLTERTKIFSITAASNVVGTMPEIKKMIQKVRKNSSATVIVDGAQYIPHYPVSVQDMDCDFLVFSGHKMLSAMGIGVLYGKEELLNDLGPFLYGGDMIEYVYEDKASFLPAPHRFEAGTPNVSGAKSLMDAIMYIENIGIEQIMDYEQSLTNYCYNQMIQKKYLDVYTTSNPKRSPVISFNFKEAHPHDVASILDTYGIAIRSGHHCAQPLHRYLGCNFSCRASFAFYNTKEEIDEFITHLDDVRKVMGIGS